MTSSSLFKNKNILVTGSSGLLGSWLVEDLLNEKANVTGVSIDDSKDQLLISKNIIDKIENHYLDISNYQAIEEIVIDKKYDMIFHLAAQTQVVDALKNPINTLKSNIQGTWNMLELSRLNNIPIVSASSDKAYGISKDLPYLETHPLKGEFPYEVSKSSSDLITSMYKNTYGVNAATLRCGNIYGGGDLNWNRLIPGVVRFLLKGDKPILRTNGEFVREWVYVKDVSKAYIETGKAIIKKENNFVAYNFSSGERKTVMEIYEIISELIKGEIIIPEIKEDSKFEIINQELDSTRIKNDLGIESTYKFKDTIKETINWYKEYLQL
tara:strand:- start:2922 stop:3896 length:975 start_codon:yes stop_codon:yes gene_type:complete